MIRINLLPKKTSKKMGVVQHLTLSGALLGLTVIVIAYLWMGLNSQISDLKKQVAVARAEKEKLKDVNTEKTKYERNIAKLKNQLDIIIKIKEKRFLPVRLFDDLTMVLDRDTPVWLTKFSVTDGNIQMEGIALSNRNLADFVTRLEKTPFYREVDLLYSEKVKKEDREIYKFSLNAKAQTEDIQQVQKGVQ
jgi:type IV pilus assembly protein PilN